MPGYISRMFVAIAIGYSLHAPLQVASAETNDLANTTNLEKKAAAGQKDINNKGLGITHSKYLSRLVRLLDEEGVMADLGSKDKKRLNSSNPEYGPACFFNELGYSPKSGWRPNQELTRGELFGAYRSLCGKNPSKEDISDIGWFTVTETINKLLRSVEEYISNTNSVEGNSLKQNE